MQTGQSNNTIKLNNAGLSLVELVVVIAIMMALVAVMGMSISAIDSGNMKKVTDNVQAALERTKILAMAKSNAYLVIENTGSQLKLQIESLSKGDDSTSVATVENVVELGDTSKMVLYYGTDSSNENSLTELGSSQKLILSYKSTGEMKHIIDQASYTDAKAAVSETGDDLYYIVAKTKSGSRVSTIKLYPHTGKLEVKK